MTLSRRPIAVCTLIAVALILGVSRSSEAALFLKIEANAATASCDNGTAAGVAACSANGFATTLDSNLISFTGDVGGYALAGMNVGANVPGTASSAYVLDTRFDVSHASGPGALQVSFGGYNFTQPVGPDLSLSATQTASWTTSAVGDSVTFQAWGRTDNLPEIPSGAATAVGATPGAAAAAVAATLGSPGAGVAAVGAALGSPGEAATAIAATLGSPGAGAAAVGATLGSPGEAATVIAATLVSPGGAAADASTVEAPFTTLATPFALVGTATIQQAIGETASYSATVAAQDAANNSADDVSAAAVPEPSTMVLLGTGVVGLFFWRRRNERMMSAMRGENPSHTP